MISPRNAVPLALVLLSAACAPAARSPTLAGEWVSGPTDLRKMTAIVRVTPPARLKAAFEATAARSDDPDLASFLQGHASGAFGSGFLMVHRSPEGTAAFVVTNRHVVAEAEEAEVSFGDGTTYKGCEVVYASPKHDLAVLALPESAIRALGHGLRPAARDADDRLGIIAAGYPGVSGRPSYQITDGKISNASFSTPELGAGSYLQHTAPIDPGSSGGPLTDESGALVGVNVMLMRKRSSVFLAVPASAVTETVRHAHSLSVKKRSATWMTAELGQACTTLASELGSAARSPERLQSLIANAFVADRGVESYGIVSSTPIGAPIREAFFQDPFIAMRTSVLVRVAMRSMLAGGATGTCTELNPADAASIADGRPVRLGLRTKDGASVELIWSFEHGSWRVAGGDIALANRVVEIDEPRPAKAPARTNAKWIGKAGGK